MQRLSQRIPHQSVFRWTLLPPLSTAAMQTRRQQSLPLRRFQDVMRWTRCCPQRRTSRMHTTLVSPNGHSMRRPQRCISCSEPQVRYQSARETTQSRMRLLETAVEGASV
jgi:predicted metal-binding protein